MSNRQFHVSLRSIESLQFEFRLHAIKPKNVEIVA